MDLSSQTKQSGGGDGFAVGLGRRIRAARLARGMTQAELGAPFTRAYVSQVEAGLTVPSLWAFVHLAERLGAAPCELLPWSGTGAEALHSGPWHEQPGLSGGPQLDRQRKASGVGSERRAQPPAGLRRS
jgi:transcriptional regulator with XRE-family HTH domain